MRATKAIRLAGLAVAGASVLALIAGPAPAVRRTFPGTDGKLAFGLGSSIVTVNPDGTDMRTVVAPSSGLPARDPAWSADGNRIAFQATAGTTPGIWTVGADGTAAKRVTTQQNDHTPTWSPDDKKLAFVRAQGGVDTLFTANADGTGAAAVTTSPAVTVANPEWSPDGSRFAFSNGSRIYVMNADGSNQQLITGLESGNANYPSWAPDGKRIAFAGQGGIRVVQPDSGGVGVLVPLNGEVWEVSWAPDGKRIAFVQDVVGPLQEELWVANADGSGLKRLNVDSDTSVSWGVQGSAPAAIPAPTGTPTGTVLVNGKPFASGSVPYNATVDVTTGSLVLRSTTGDMKVYGAGGVPAVFVLKRGTDNGRPIVELALTRGDFSACPKRKKSSATAAPQTVRQLWGDGKGSFRTRGRYAAAAVRGTKWLTADRCDGTLTRVVRGIVTVADLPKKKQVTVRAGKTYLARP